MKFAILVTSIPSAVGGREGELKKKERKRTREEKETTVSGDEKETGISGSRVDIHLAGTFRPFNYVRA